MSAMKQDLYGKRYLSFYMMILCESISAILVRLCICKGSTFCYIKFFCVICTEGNLSEKELFPHLPTSHVDGLQGKKLLIKVDLIGKKKNPSFHPFFSFSSNPGNRITSILKLREAKSQIIPVFC